jgi:hypothetical protein
MPRVNSKNQKGGATKCQFELKPDQKTALSNFLAMAALEKVPEGTRLAADPSPPEKDAVVDALYNDWDTLIPAGMEVQEEPKGTRMPQKYHQAGLMLFGADGKAMPKPADKGKLLEALNASIEETKKAPAAAVAPVVPATVVAAQGVASPPLTEAEAAAAGKAVTPGGYMFGGKRKPAKKASKKSSKKASKKSSAKMVGGAKKKSSKKSSKKASKKSSAKMVGGAKKKAGSKKAGSKKAGSKKAGSKKAGSKKRAVKKN